MLNSINVKDTLCITSLRPRAFAVKPGAASFIKKPDTHQQTQQKIGTFFKYWFEVAEV
jgi:hypothetical protein